MDLLFAQVENQANSQRLRAILMRDEDLLLRTYQEHMMLFYIQNVIKSAPELAWVAECHLRSMLIRSQPKLIKNAEKRRNPFFKPFVPKMAADRIIKRRRI